MVGTLVNVAAVAVGSLVGMSVRSRLPEKYVSVAFQGIGLVTLAIGVSMSLQAQNLILVILSVVGGAILGEWIGLEARLDGFAKFLKQRTKIASDRFNEGFVTSSMLFCVGSMSVLGAFEDGMGSEPKLLFAKSLMDGVSAIAFASTFGIGVLFSVIPVFLYQGALTLFAVYLMSFMNTTVIADLNGVGGVLLLGLGLSILNIKKIRVTNMLPSLVIIVVLSYFFGS